MEAPVFRAEAPPASRFLRPPAGGLTSRPRAFCVSGPFPVTAAARATTLRAAFASRSRTRPPAAYRNVRSPRAAGRTSLPRSGSTACCSGTTGPPRRGGSRTRRSCKPAGGGSPPSRRPPPPGPAAGSARESVASRPAPSGWSTRATSPCPDHYAAPSGCRTGSGGPPRGLQAQRSRPPSSSPATMGPQPPWPGSTLCATQARSRDLHGFAPPAGVQALLDQRQAPFEGEARRPHMRGQGPLHPERRIQGETERA